MAKTNNASFTEKKRTPAKVDDMICTFNHLLHLRNRLIISGYSEHYCEKTISDLLDRMETDLITEKERQSNETVFSARI